MKPTLTAIKQSWHLMAQSARNRIYQNICENTRQIYNNYKTLKHTLLSLCLFFFVFCSFFFDIALCLSSWARTVEKPQEARLPDASKYGAKAHRFCNRIATCRLQLKGVVFLTCFKFFFVANLSTIIWFLIYVNWI